MAIEKIPLPAGGWAAVLRGDPSPEELAALVLAVDVAAVARARQALQPPAWLRAARREGLGAAPVASPADLGAASRSFS